MKRLTILSLVLVFAGFTQIAQGQWARISAPGSVTSPAPGRQFLPPPSVIATGPQGWHGQRFAHGNRFVFVRPGFEHRGFHHRGQFSGSIFAPVYVPYGEPYYPMYVDPGYGYDYNAAPPASSMYQPDPNYAGQYGLVDPRKRTNPNAAVSGNQTSNENSTPAAESAPVANNKTTASAAPAPAAPKPQPTTILVFKDGHRQEVTNYVIQGATLFNLGDNGPRKVQIADLDVDATMKVNDDRGVEFSLP